MMKLKVIVPSLHKSTLSDTRQKDNICKDDQPCSDNVPYVNLADNVRFNLPQNAKWLDLLPSLVWE